MAEFSTGELRAALQRIVFLRLTAPAGDLPAGTVVAAQYWGNGQVVLTRFPDSGGGTRLVAHQIRGEWLPDLEALLVGTLPAVPPANGARRVPEWPNLTPQESQLLWHMASEHGFVGGLGVTSFDTLRGAHSHMHSKLDTAGGHPANSTEYSVERAREKVALWADAEGVPQE